MKGREIVFQPDARLRSEIGRFHKGISLTLCVLAGLITTVEIARRYDLADRVLLCTTLLLVLVAARRTVSALTSQMEGVKDAHPGRR
ncbi:MAG: hypothetical protein ACLPWF_16495 [Bryobacteraceae bacterium]|jgi:hypothetical protein